jgi:hypothetical protein
MRRQSSTGYISDRSLISGLRKSDSRQNLQKWLKFGHVDLKFPAAQQL